MNVDGMKYSGNEEVLQGFKKHFQMLAEHSKNVKFDEKYKQADDSEVKHIQCLVSDIEIGPITPEELEKAVQSMNLRKAAYYSVLTIENIIYRGLI